MVSFFETMFVSEAVERTMDLLVDEPVGPADRRLPSDQRDAREFSTPSTVVERRTM